MILPLKREPLGCVADSMKHRYSILSTIIETEKSVDCLQAFETKEGNDNSPHMVLELQDDSKENRCYGIQYMDPKQAQLIKSLFFCQKDKTQYLYASEEDYSKLHINVNETCSEEIFLELFIVGFYSYMSMKNTLLMHASAVAYEGNGIVFTAASGIGKTTQAELWAQYKNAKILNGDKVFLKQEEDGIHAWGSPWKGSSPYACDESAKLRAIVVLEQAEENSIQKLTVLEAMQQFVPHVFFPCWDERCEQAVLTFLDQVLEETEIFLLKCRPDETAVELLAARLDEEKDH